MCKNLGWPIRIAPYITHGLIAGSAIYINLRFRKTLKLRTEGFAFAAFTSAAPAAVLFGGLDTIARRKILENDYNPARMQKQYAAVYAGCGILHPLVVSPIVNLYVGAKYNLKTPDLLEFRKVGQLFLTTIKPIRSVLIGLSLGFAFLGAFIGSQTMQSVYFVHHVIAELHRDYLDSYEKKKIEKQEQMQID